MMMHADTEKRSALTTLDAAAVAARSGFACLFSSSDEYERALISERASQGRYRSPSRAPLFFFIGLAFVVAGTALLLA